jgi:hypothetical protein
VTHRWQPGQSINQTPLSRPRKYSQDFDRIPKPRRHQGYAPMPPYALQFQDGIVRRWLRPHRRPAKLVKCWAQRWLAADGVAGKGPPPSRPSHSSRRGHHMPRNGTTDADLLPIAAHPRSKRPPPAAGLSGRDRRSRTRPGLKPQLKISRTRSGMPLASLQGCLLHRGSDCVGTSSSKRRGNHRFQSWNERVGMRALELRIYPTTANEEDAS